MITRHDNIVTSPFDPSKAKETPEESYESGIEYVLNNLI